MLIFPNFGPAEHGTAYRLPIGRWLCPDVTVVWMLIVSLHVHVAADDAVFTALPSVCVSNLQNAPVLVGVFLTENGCCSNLTINYCSYGSRLSPDDPPHSATMTPRCLSVANCENSTLSRCTVWNVSCGWGPKFPVMDPKGPKSWVTTCTYTHVHS